MSWYFSFVTKTQISYKGERNGLSAQTFLQNLTAQQSPPFFKRKSTPSSSKKAKTAKLLFFQRENIPWSDSPQSPAAFSYSINPEITESQSGLDWKGP